MTNLELEKKQRESCDCDQKLLKLQKNEYHTHIHDFISENDMQLINDNNIDLKLFNIKKDLIVTKQ